MIADSDTASTAGTSRLAAVLPAAFVAALAVGQGVGADGSFRAEHWLAYALLAALGLAAVLFAGAARLTRPAAAAIAALLALAAWTGASLAWSPAPADARDDALLVLFYAAAFAIPAVTVRDRRDLLSVLGIVAAAAAGVAVWTAADLRLADEVTGYFRGGRLYFFPLSYANATAAFFLLGLWPAVVLASRRTLPLAARAPALGAAAVTTGGWVLTQSKGAALGLAASALAVLALSRERLRLLVPLLLVAAPSAVAYRPLTAPFRADGDAALEAAARDAGSTLLVLTFVGVALGAVYAAADARLSLGPRTQRAVRLAAAAACAGAVVAGAVAFNASVDSPAGFVRDRWDAFKTLPPAETGESHFQTLGSNRYDFWRVALDEFRTHPVAGVGARGFAAKYLLERRSGERPVHVHSLPIGVVMELGVIGLALLAVALAIPLAAAARRARDDPAAAAVVGAGVYWVAHSSVDWIHAVPAASLACFLLLGAAVGGDGARIRGRTATLAGVATAVVGFVVLAPPWLSARLTRHSYAQSASDAARSLKWARVLDPLSTAPYIAEAQQAPAPAARATALRGAVEEQPGSANLHRLLGNAYAAAGRRDDARRELRLALRLDPRNEFLRRDLDRLGG